MSSSSIGTEDSRSILMVFKIFPLVCIKRNARSVLSSVSGCCWLRCKMDVFISLNERRRVSHAFVIVFEAVASDFIRRFLTELVALDDYDITEGAGEDKRLEEVVLGVGSSPSSSSTILSLSSSEFSEWNAAL